MSAACSRAARAETRRTTIEGGRRRGGRERHALGSRIVQGPITREIDTATSLRGSRARTRDKSRHVARARSIGRCVAASGSRTSMPS